MVRGAEVSGPPENPITPWNRENARETVAAWKTLLGTGETPLRYQANTELFRKGQEARDVFLLAEGLILLYSALPNGHENILGVRFPGQVAEQCAHDLQIPYPVSARTLLSSTIYRISATELRNRERHNREISILSERLLRIDLYNAAVFIAELKATNAADRLERFLRLLASVFGSTSDAGVVRVAVPLRDDELGDMLGCSPRHFKRIKKQLQQAGRLRVDRNRVFVLTAQ